MGPTQITVHIWHSLQPVYNIRYVCKKKIDLFLFNFLLEQGAVSALGLVEIKYDF